jgi:hypothetical protein
MIVLHASEQDCSNAETYGTLWYGGWRAWLLHRLHGCCIVWERLCGNAVAVNVLALQVLHCLHGRCMCCHCPLIVQFHAWLHKQG